ncbi:MAG: DUF938 domain-containing protein [Cyanobacteriota bacterium]|nr:DUF938 domain-containing protein [Cyanobacteriota bacterium]
MAANGLLLLYGPFLLNDEPTTASNAAFDAHLRSLDPAMGLRDAGWIETQARSQGFALLADVAMPAHNITLIFRLASGAVRGVPRPDRSPLQQQQLARGQEGQEVPIKGHQTFTAGEHGGHSPAPSSSRS